MPRTDPDLSILDDPDDAPAAPSPQTTAGPGDHAGFLLRCARATAEITRVRNVCVPGTPEHLLAVTARKCTLGAAEIARGRPHIAVLRIEDARLALAQLQSLLAQENPNG